MNDVDVMTTGEQITDWKNELKVAMADRQWRNAIQLCSWLRYALWQQESTDPEVEEALQRAKEGLTEQTAQEEKRQKLQDEHRRRRDKIMHKIANSQSTDALASIEEFFQDGAHSEEVINLLQKLKTRFSRRLGLSYQQKDPQAGAFGRRIDNLEDLVRNRR